MRKSLSLVAALVAALAWATPSFADTILFDTNGGGAGGVVQVDTFDWAPGNSLLEEGALIPNGGGTTAGTILFQANLGTLLFGTPAGVPVFSNGTGGNFFTAVAAFDAVIAPGGGVFTILPGGTLKIYATAAPGNDLAGTGFTTGVNILSATAINGAGSLIPFPEVPGTVNLNPGGCTPTTGVLINCLDQFGPNNYGGFFTINGTGGTTVNARVDTFNSAYFLNLIAGQSVAFTNTSNNLPYRQVDPSAAFSSNAIANGNVVGVASTCGLGQTPGLDCVNGTGNNIIAQADANTSFTGITAVPEPASMTLLGLGLLGAAARRRRGAKNAK